MSTDDDDVEEMAECGACRAVVPVNSTECSGCGVSFTGVSDSNLGECGACGALVPLDSKSCTQCGVVFVADDVIQILDDWLKATGLSVVELFKRFDTNGDGVIEASEFKTGLLALNIADLPESQVERLVKTLDEDGDGVIDLNELESTFAPQDNEPSKHVGPEDEDGADDESEEDSDGADDKDTSEDSGDEDSEDTAEDSGDEEEDSDDADDEDSEDTGEDSGDEEEDSDDEDSEDTAEDSGDEEEDSDDGDSDDEPVEEVPDTPLGRMIKNFKDAGYNAQMAFEHMDVNNDGQIDNEELEKALTEFGGGIITNEDVEEVMKEVDFDENGSISIEELVSAFGEQFEEESDSVEESDASADSDKEFPTDLQKKLMSKKANDIFWPIMHALFGLFMVLWIANGLGVFVSGEGGMVIHSGDSFIDADGNLVADGDSTQCDKAQGHECSNSLTPLSGDASSMPAGFYWDGILMTMLGTAGLVGSLYAHLVLMKAWRARAKGDSSDEADTTDEDTSKEDSGDEDSDDDEEKEDSDSDEEDDDSGDDEDEEDSDSDEEDDDSGDDEDEEDSEDEEGSDSDDEDDSEDDEGEDIDVGSRVGIEVDGEEIFGTIIEFNDEDDTVVIEDEETGDEIEAPQESMFLE
ncbi:MAG: EF-hand domain-containing protein [Candidatus Poseidoniaceae archaeon]|nr:EF-hand domain-containing protein [Candidatus Poseidoniaceae archaeon]